MTPSLLAATLIMVGLITLVFRILGRGPKNQRRQEDVSLPIAEETSRPLTLVEAREYLARKDTEEARKYLEHMATLKSVHKHLRMEAREQAPSLLGACVGALFLLFFTFLFVLTATASTKSWWVDQQFRVLGITTNATLTDLVERGRRRDRYYADYEYTVALPNQTQPHFRDIVRISSEQASTLRQSLRQATPQRRLQVSIEYLPSDPTKSRLKPQNAALPAWLQGVIVGLLVSFSNLWAILAVKAVVSAIDPQASAAWTIGGATLILIGSYIVVFWFMLFVNYPPF
jgi:hypothetical protein